MLDESTETTDKNSTDAGHETSANLSSPSAVEEITSKIVADKQYGGADVKKIVENALSADGRTQKSRAEQAEAENKLLKSQVTTLGTQYNSVTSQVQELIRAQNEADADKVKDDPVALGSLRARQANAAEAIRLQGENATLEAGKAQLQAEREAIAADKVSLSIKLVAMATGVDEKKLAERVPDGNSERLALVAADLKGAPAAPVIDPKTGKPVVDPKTGKPAALTTTPVTAQSTGGEGSGIRQIVERAKRRAGVIT